MARRIVDQSVSIICHPVVLQLGTLASWGSHGVSLLLWAFGKDDSLPL